MSARNTYTVLFVLFATFVGGCEKVENDDAATKSSETGSDATETTIYSVATYDPAADPAKDLAATVASAQQDGKRIILEVGGKW